MQIFTSGAGKVSVCFNWKMLGFHFFPRKGAAERIKSYCMVSSVNLGFVLIVWSRKNKED